MPFVQRLLDEARSSGKSPVCLSLKRKGVKVLAEIVAVYHKSLDPTSSRVVAILNDGEQDIAAIVPRKLFCDRVERFTGKSLLQCRLLVKIECVNVECSDDARLSASLKRYQGNRPVILINNIDYLGPGFVLPLLPSKPFPDPLESPFDNRIPPKKTVDEAVYALARPPVFQSTMTTLIPTPFELPSGGIDSNSRADKRVVPVKVGKAKEGVPLMSLMGELQLERERLTVEEKLALFRKAKETEFFGSLKRKLRQPATLKAKKMR